MIHFSMVRFFEINTKKQFFQYHILYEEIFTFNDSNGGIISCITCANVDYKESVYRNVVGNNTDNLALILAINYRKLLT